MDWNKVSAELSKKLDPANIKPAKQFGPKGDYLEGWFCMAEANRIFGHDGWSYSIMDCKPVSEAARAIGKDKKDGFGVSYVATIRVMVDGVIREDVGAGHGYDVDLGLAHESAIKESVTDALKRGLRGFGNPFGLALYDKSRSSVGVDASAEDIASAVNQIGQCSTVEKITNHWRCMPDEIRNLPDVIEAAKARKAELTKNKSA